MNTIKLDISQTLGTIGNDTIAALRPEADAALAKVDNGTGAGNDFLGWVDLPARLDKQLIDDINLTAARLRNECQVVVAIGIGGSYLGAKAVIEALSEIGRAHV